jgi:hypothetical protein
MPRRTLLAAALLGIFALAEFLMGNGSTALRLRDLAPFLYLAAIPVFSQSISPDDTGTMVRSVWLVLWIHSAWAVPAAFGLLEPVAMADSASKLPLFLLRTDYDGPVLIAGALFALSVRHLQMGLKGTLLLAVSSLAAVPMLGSRATALGMLSALTYLVIFQGRLLMRVLLSPAIFITFLLLISGLLVVAITAPQVLTSNLLAQRLGLGGESSAATGAQGTVFGRRTAWRLVWESTANDPSLRVFGWGPGAEIVRDTGALKYLSGDPTVRAPHNGFVHLFARYGIVGCLVWVGLLLLFLSSSGPRPPPEMRMPFRLLGGSLAASLLTAAAVGVILESPFGALTIYFGLTIARHSGGGEGHDWVPSRSGTPREEFAGATDAAISWGRGDWIPKCSIRSQVSAQWRTG